MEDEGKVSKEVEEYLNDKFPKAGEGDSDISGFLADKFNTQDLPGGQKKNPTIEEQLKGLKKT